MLAKYLTSLLLSISFFGAQYALAEHAPANGPQGRPAATSISVTIDGVTYQCSQGGVVNQCKCGRGDFNSPILQKFIRSKNTFKTLEGFNTEEACQEARKTDPRCFFEE